MDSDDPKVDHTDVVDSVMDMFSEVMSREAITAIVEHYGGDLNQTVDAIVNMSEEGGLVSQNTNNICPSMDQPTFHQTNQQNMAEDLITPSTGVIPKSQSYVRPQDQTTHLTNIVNQSTEAHRLSTPSTGAIAKSPQSYSGASQNKTGFPKRIQKPKTKTLSVFDLQMKQIIEYHNQGHRTLILLRGVPGSGKSHLAKQMVETMCPGVLPKTHILSTDDYFIVRGEYRYDRSRLSDAHDWNRNRVTHAMSRGLSPVIVDNTHVKLWEMEPYVKLGVYCGYIIEVLEPNTPWARKAFLCAQKNSHNVPIGSIRRMLDNYEDVPSGVSLIRMYGLSYPPDKTPPVIRNFPPVLGPEQPSTTFRGEMQMMTETTATNLNEKLPVVDNNQTQSSSKQSSNSCQNKEISFVNNSHTNTETTGVLYQQEPAFDTNPATSCGREGAVSCESESKSKLDDGDNSQTDDVALTPEAIEKLRKQFEEIEKLDQEWENGENWDEVSEPKHNPENRSSFNPQPPRRHTVHPEQFFVSPFDCNNDWSKISMYLPPWNDHSVQNPLDTPIIKAETTSVGTSVDYGDTDPINKNFKILIGTPKDINFYYMGLNEERIPNKRMLDKSSMTNDHDHIATKVTRCKNEEKHFEAICDTFSTISRDYLRDIFDKCLGDVNWAVDIICESFKNQNIPIVINQNISHGQDFDEPCDCLAAYNIIPNVNTQEFVAPSNVAETVPQIVAGPSITKCKKDNKSVLESTLLLKRQIEQNVVISDNHYSQHCLKIRKMRRGEVNDNRGDSAQDETAESTATTTPNLPDTAAEATLSTDDEDSQTTCSDDNEGTVNVDLGSVLVSELDERFGRNGMVYPESFSTKVNMPISLLNEINAIWLESMIYQFDQQTKQSQCMIRQDEEFARQLAAKEEELARAGQEPAIPDLKEIMDMELALSIYKKEITAEWRNNVPNDLAARMTREKLNNLFPDVMPETLSELLMAHDNNFNATVEVLLSSTGNEQILEEENGVAKFIAKKELDRQKKILEEEKKALCEVEWPLLPQDVKVDMKTVEGYRAQASQFLAQRNLYHQKAQEFFKRNMTDVATYYSDVATMNTKRFEQANSLAAASLIQVHASNSSDNATIDLHFLHVPEARESLDLFLDTHIQKLRELKSKGPAPRFHTLMFITGRGLHSHGGPKIKPAVKRRLRERHIGFCERNPGLLSSKVCAEDKMTYELP